MRYSTSAFIYGTLVMKGWSGCKERRILSPICIPYSRSNVYRYIDVCSAYDAPLQSSRWLNGFNIFLNPRRSFWSLSPLTFSIVILEQTQVQRSERFFGVRTNWSFIDHNDYTSWSSWQIPGDCVCNNTWAACKISDISFLEINLQISCRLVLDNWNINMHKHLTVHANGEWFVYHCCKQ